MASALALASLAGAAPARAQDVEVRLHWENRELPGRMQVYAVATGADTVLWQTGNVEALAELPLAEELTERPIAVPRGRTRRLVLVYRNDSDSPRYFFAAPHHAEPEESSLGFHFKCLCVNHAFEAGPRRFWYRIVEIRLDRHFSGERLGVMHSLIGIDKIRRDRFSGLPEH